MSATKPWYQTSVSRLALIVAVCTLPLLLARAVREAREAARRAQCAGNLKQLGLAMHNYHSVYDCFPPAYLSDDRGRPMHSWRVLILPFLEQAALYNQYDFDEPWDGPNNTRLARPGIGLRRSIPSSFVCPSHHGPEDTILTDYVLVTGPGTAFPGERSMKIADIGDGTSRTLMLVESVDARVHWMEPRDLDVRTMEMAINGPERNGISSLHRGGANVSFCDGAIHFLKDHLAPARLKAYLTPNGGEQIDPY